MSLLFPILLGYLQTLGAPWFLILLALVFAGSVLWSNKAMGKPRTRADIRASLKHRNPARIYRRAMGRSLYILYRWLTPQAESDRPKPYKGLSKRLYWLLPPRAQTPVEARRLAISGWSWPVLDKAMLFAVVYPILSLVLFWVLTGQDAGLGALVVIDQEDRLWPRAALICIVALILMSQPLAQSLASSQIRAVRQISSWTPITILLVAFTGAIEVAGLFAFAGAVAISFAVAFGGSLAGAVAGALAGAGAVAVAVTLAVAFTVAVAAAGAVSTRIGHGLLGYLGLSLALASGLLATAAFAQDALTPEAASLLVFLGLFPLINAWFDFVSYAATLRLARWGLRGHGRFRPFVAAFADLGLAFTLFTALGAALLAGIAALNAAAGIQVFPLQPLFDSLRSDRAFADNWWIFLMLFSTALPTFAHLCIASTAAQSLLGPKTRLWLLAQMDAAEDSLSASAFYHAGMATIWTLSIMVPIFLVGGLLSVLWVYHPEIGQTYLQVFEWIAVWLGLITEGGPGLLPQAIWV